MVKRLAGFTLIELSIVLVIIGLIVGGILVGQDLIKATEVRAQISQIEKYNQAVNTFRAKFGALPGDMPPATGNQYGFVIDSTCDGSQPGFRNGDGLLQGWNGSSTLAQAEGETALFWQDLSSSVAGSLIDGQFPNGGSATMQCHVTGPTLTTTPGTTYLGDYFPVGKIGHGSFVFAYTYNGYNWYGLESVITEGFGGYMYASADIPVFQAYNMDKKIDDGLPTSGAVQANYLNANVSASLTVPAAAPNTAADTTSSCYNTTSNVYSMSSLANYGAGGNCALSFRFQ